MERVTISVSDAFAADLGRFMAEHGYANRSEALRDLARAGLERARTDGVASGACFATLVYVYNHQTRELARRLTESHHARHDLEVATLHVHLDHEHCLEVALLRGEAAEVKDFSASVIAQRGVLHGQVSFVPVRVEEHAHDADGRPHLHVRPASE
jgi:CopG family nickel-responsive transcriptional regulator